MDDPAAITAAAAKGLEFTLVINPGDAPVEVIQQLLEAICDARIEAGGIGYTFKMVEAGHTDSAGIRCIPDRCPWCGGPGLVTRDGEVLSVCACRH